MALNVSVFGFFLRKHKANVAAEYIHLFVSFKNVSVAKIAHIFEKNKQKTIKMLLISALLT